ncbi:astacin, partial [Ancylostoma caninum]
LSLFYNVEISNNEESCKLTCFSERQFFEVGTAAHEIGHTLGFFHTHSRHDRDKFIRFIPENVESKYLDEFTKQTTLTNENYGIPYDYGSIMHYGTTMASSNDQPTMLALDAKYTQTMGSPFVSFYDLIMMNFHYGCNSMFTYKESISDRIEVDKSIFSGFAQKKMLELSWYPNVISCP